MNKVIFVFLFLSLLLASHILAADSDSLLNRSELWPKKVSVFLDLVGQKHGNTIESGTEGVLLRVEEGKVLVDMGHGGLFRVDAEDTDVAKRAAELEGKRTKGNQGLIQFRHSKSFFIPSLQKAQKAHDLDHVGYFLFYYDMFRPEDKLPSERLEKLRASFENLLSEVSLMPMIIPLNDDYGDSGLVEYLVDKEFHVPVVLPYLRSGVVRSLYHEPVAGQAVLCDKNGRIIKEYRLDEIEEVFPIVRSDIQE